MLIKNINKTDWKENKNQKGESWRSLDLSGTHLGVRIEELAPGSTSSTHHYHTLEEEHVLILEGKATLVLDSESRMLEPGDHIFFAAGNEEAHHIENTSRKPFKYLVFGERNEQDIVVYPEHKVMMIKALDFKQFTYRPLILSEAPDDDI